jgi:hypothetical protein
MRINKETEAVTDMGVSIDFLSALNIIDGYLYLNSADYDIGGCCVEIKPCKINLDKIRDITYFDYETTGIASVGAPVIIIDETIYFINGNNSKINRDGTDGSVINDNFYRVIGVDNNAIYAYLIEAEDNEFITGDDGLQQHMTWVYKLSSDWKPEQRLFQFAYENRYPLDGGSYSGLSIFTAIYDGYMYSIMPTKYDFEHNGFYDYILYRNRLAKNTEKEILYEFGEDYARILAVTEDGVYFYFYHRATEETTLETRYISNIHRVNHNGGEIEELSFKYDVYNFNKYGYYFVSNIDGKLYAIINNKILLVY